MKISGEPAKRNELHVRKGACGRSTTSCAEATGSIERTRRATLSKPADFDSFPLTAVGPRQVHLSKVPRLRGRSCSPFGARRPGPLRSHGEADTGRLNQERRRGRRCEIQDRALELLPTRCQCSRAAILQTQTETQLSENFPPCFLRAWERNVSYGSKHLGCVSAMWASEARRERVFACWRPAQRQLSARFGVCVS